MACLPDFTNSLNPENTPQNSQVMCSYERLSHEGNPSTPNLRDYFYEEVESNR